MVLPSVGVVVPCDGTTLVEPSVEWLRHTSSLCSPSTAYEQSSPVRHDGSLPLISHAFLPVLSNSTRGLTISVLAFVFPMAISASLR